ncbi:MAG: xanthine dehydrogenase family protein molybdopterin-binding subunit [Steroidobacteraceae bacterium]
MSRLGRMTRRTLLVGSVAIAGGVAFGTWRVRTPYENPLLDDLAEGEASFNPWVKVTASGITLIVPHADLGQGVASMQAALIAEEMDLDFGQFDTDFGEPAPAYWNRAAGSTDVPFLSSDDGLAANATRGLMNAVFKLMGMQLTGGSSSVPDSWVKLREAGATARETLKLAASLQRGIPLAELSTRDGAVLLPGGEQIPYTLLAAEAASLEPVRDVPLRAPDQWRLIGKPMQRLDIIAKSTGQQTYGIDLKIEGMQHAAARANPRRGELLGFDAARALAMPGVVEVLPVTRGVAVVADHTWNAFQAVAAVECEWGPAPYPAEQAAHWAEVAASFTEERLDKVWREEGDVVAELNTGEVVEAEYRAPYVAHQPLEPLSAIVRVDEEGVEVWAGHQLPRFLQQKVAAITGHEPEQVRFHNQYMGGSFGHRLEFDNVTLCAEIANRRRGTPIKLTYTREEDFAQDYPRQIGMARGRGMVRDGRVQALDLAIATVSSSSSQMGRLGQSIPGPDGQIVAGVWNLPYAIPHFRVSGYKVPELAPTSSWRAVGASTGGFFAETFLDELIHAAGADPLEERLRLCNEPLSRKVLEAVGELSGWGTPMGPGRGRGIAFVESFGVQVAEVVEVTDTGAGIRIDRVFAVAEVGRVVDPVNFDNLFKGGVAWGLGHAMNCEITYADGMPQQSNFHVHAGLRLYQCPEITVRGLENGARVRGIGEPPVPPAAPALANAIFAATGKRLRDMPFSRQVSFV